MKKIAFLIVFMAFSYVINAQNLGIYNSNGDVITFEQTNPVSTANRTVLNLQGLPSGLYYVQLGTSSEMFDVKTLIVR